MGMFKGEGRSMSLGNMDAMLWFAGHWWWFPRTQITVESQFEWKNGWAYLLEVDGTAIEGSMFAGEVSSD